MKYVVCVLASVVALAACNKGPKVDVHNATGNEVAQAVKQSGVMSSETMIEPGLWRPKVTVLQMNIPGIPAQYAAQMKQSMAEHEDRSSEHCVTAEQVKKPKEDFFGADKSCRYEHFAMGGGKMDIQMVCRGENMTRTTNMSGTYTPSSYSMDMSSEGSGGGQNGMSMKMHVDSQRVGECGAKQD